MVAKEDGKNKDMGLNMAGCLSLYISSRNLPVGAPILIERP
jgi:hypothetical protein